MLKFLLYLLIIFFVLRGLGRFFVVKTFNNLNQRMQDQMNQQARQREAPPEGHISVDPNPGKRTGRSNDAGEYVDYEEVK